MSVSPLRSNQMSRILTLWLLCLPLLHAETVLYWGHPPHSTTDAAAHPKQGGTPQQFHLYGLQPHQPCDIRYYLPTLEFKVLACHEGNVTLPRTGLNNYHALVALSKTPRGTSSSVRYLYHHGKPSGNSPSELVTLPKLPLEIVPSPLPREHDRYTGSKSYTFELRVQDKPFPYQNVEFSTENGTTQTLTTDEGGQFTFTLPDDFHDVQTGRRANPPAEFTLYAHYQDRGRTHTTTLTMPYSVNPNDYWRSELLGFIVLLLGFITGYFLIRRYVHSQRNRPCDPS